MKKVIEVCDKCEDTSRPVAVYTVTGKGRRRRTVLCSEHGSYLDTLLGTSELPRKRNHYAGGKLALTTLDEIEKTKVPHPT